MGIVEALLQSFGHYYGLDWLALLAGVTGSYLLTSRNRWGFCASGIGCVAGFGAAVLSGQFGFIAYNLIILALMARGFVLWGRAMPEAAE